MQSQYQRLTDSQWEVIKDFLPIHRKRNHCLRVIVDGIFWCLRVGNQWRNLPDSFPKWQLVYYYFRRWQSDGTLKRLNFLLNRRERERLARIQVWTVTRKSTAASAM